MKALVSVALATLFWIILIVITALGLLPYIALACAAIIAVGAVALVIYEVVFNDEGDTDMY